MEQEFTNMKQHAEYVVGLLNNATTDFKDIYIYWKLVFFKKYHNGLITSSSHGISYFDNIIKYWDNPKDYCSMPKKGEDSYEYNFVSILNKNKQ